MTLLLYRIVLFLNVCYNYNSQAFINVINLKFEFHSQYRYKDQCKKIDLDALV